MTLKCDRCGHTFHSPAMMEVHERLCLTFAQQDAEDREFIRDIKERQQRQIERLTTGQPEISV